MEGWAVEPGFKLWSGAEAEGAAEVEGVVEAGALVVEHDVVGSGDAHDVVDAGGSEEGEEGVHVVLIGLSVVGVADVAAHGEAEEFAAEVIFKGGAGDLFAVVEVFRADEADDGVDEHGMEVAGYGVGAGLEGLLVDEGIVGAVVGVGGECRALAGFKIQDVAACRAVGAGGAPVEGLGCFVALFEEGEVDAEALVGGLCAGDRLEEQVEGGTLFNGLNLGGDVGEDAALGRDLESLADGVDHAEEAGDCRGIVADGVDADDGVAGAEEESVEEGGGDAGWVVGGVVGLEACGEAAGESDGGAELGDDADARGYGDEVLDAHEFADGGDHLRGETGG